MEDIIPYFLLDKKKTFESGPVIMSPAGQISQKATSLEKTTELRFAILPAAGQISQTNKNVPGERP